MKTLLLSDSEHDVKQAGEILKNGGLVGIPTETVYGLAANALDGEAVARIFSAKGRPMDNPLIVHIADIGDIEKFDLVADFPQKAKMLAEIFWSGPLTMIMPKGRAIPDEVSAGLDTVAIRFPEHKTAQEIIKAAGVPLAAPSANISGSPSPTTAEHVMNDLNGKINAVVDGGECRVGLESTVITMVSDTPRILRPGGITPEQIESVIGKIDIDDAVLNRLEKNEKAASPGMKYKHYSPKARVILVRGEGYINYVNSKSDKNVAALCYNDDVKKLSVRAFPLGNMTDTDSQAHTLFDRLRQIDCENYDIVYARCPKADGVGMAIYNRLIRAAGFEVIDLEKL